MKTLIPISLTLILSSIIVVALADTDPGTPPAQKVAEAPAKKAFEAVKKHLKDEKFGDSVAMLMTMKEGFRDLEALLQLCDSNLVSDDEVSRSAAFLCGEAINSLRQSGQLSKWAPEKQVDAVDKYQWKNGPELNRLAEEPGYQSKRMPSYNAFMARAAGRKQR